MNVCPLRLFPGMIAIAIVLMCMLTASPLRADDPNGLREGRRLLAASWESATRSLTALNPSAHPDVPKGSVETTIEVSGVVEVLDLNDLIAVATTHATALWAFDQDGEAVLFDPNAVDRAAGNAWVLGDRPKPFCVELPLEPDQPYVTRLSELSFTVDALYGQPFVTIDVPIAESEEWIELVPRYRIRIPDVTEGDDIFRFTVEEEILDVYSHSSWPFDPNEDYWDETARPGEGTYRLANLDVIDYVQLVDALGHRVPAGGLHTSSLLSGGRVTGMRTYTLYDHESTDDLRLRYTIAMDPYEVPILLTLTDIPIPGL